MGKFTISFDFELGWGAIETGLWKMRQEKSVYKNLRPLMRKLIAQFDEQELSATWATVGAMIDAPNGSDFSHLPRKYEQAAARFLTNSAPQTRDGRDLFDMVLGAKTPQDIGSHTYSHTRFSIAEFDEVAKEEDLKKARQSLNEFGVTPHSFVYPLNHASDFSLLARQNFKVARLGPNMPNGKFGKLWEKMRGHAPSAYQEDTGQGIQTETGSFLYTWGVNRDRKIRRRLINHQMNKSLERSANSDFHTHIWLHPFNLAEVPDLFSDLTKTLAKVASLRDEGKLSVVTMAQEKGGA